jgi:hypothetical protein
VQQNLFVNGLMKMLRKKIVIFVTNQLHFLAYPGYGLVLCLSYLSFSPFVLFQFSFSCVRLKVLYIDNGAQKLMGPLAEIQNSEEISHLIIQSGVDVGGSQSKKSLVEKQPSKMNANRDYKEKEDNAESKERGKIIKREEKKKGLVAFKTYFTYVRRGGLVLFVLVLLFQLATVTLNVYASFWLSQWASASVNSSMVLCFLYVFLFIFVVVVYFI